MNLDHKVAVSERYNEHGHGVSVWPKKCRNRQVFAKS